MVANHAITLPLDAYNFSPPSDQRIPGKLVEISLRSMSGLEGSGILAIPEQDEQDGPMEEPTLVLSGAVRTRLIPLEPLEEERVIVGVDTSSIKIGETREGLLIALRAAIVWRSKRSCRYLRLGPLLFHVTEQNKDEIYNELRRYCLGLPDAREAPSLAYMPMRLSTIFDLWARELACHLFFNSVLVFDGALAIGPDGVSQALSGLLELARSNDNSVIGLSKSSKLVVMGKPLLELLNGTPGPCLLEIDGQLPIAQSGIQLLGRIHVAKLAPFSCPFRLDVDAALPRDDGINAVRMLLSNDAIYEGYPETLRLAHIIATFTAPEVMAMQLMLSRTYGLRMIRRPDVRKLLFGPFGTGGAQD